MEYDFTAHDGYSVAYFDKTRRVVLRNCTCGAEAHYVRLKCVPAIYFIECSEECCMGWMSYSIEAAINAWHYASHWKRGKSWDTRTEIEGMEVPQKATLTT